MIEPGPLETAAAVLEYRLEHYYMVKYRLGNTTAESSSCL